MDFLKLVDYLEFQTQIPKAKRVSSELQVKIKKAEVILLQPFLSKQIVKIVS
jgi:hypothetical protein